MSQSNQEHAPGATDPSSWPAPARRSLALVAVIAAAHRVTQVATSIQARLNPEPLDAMLLAATIDRNPNDWSSLFPDPAAFRSACQVSVELLTGNGQHRQTLLYAMQLIALAERLTEQPAVRNALGDLLDGCPEPRPKLLAGIYQATISNLGQRIQVRGEPQVLQQNDTAEYIRALLLSGIRFAWLWRSQGGRRRHLVLGRRTLVKSIQSIGDHI